MFQDNVDTTEFNYKTDLRYDNLKYEFVNKVQLDDVFKWLQEGLPEGVVALTVRCPVCGFYTYPYYSFCEKCEEELKEHIRENHETSDDCKSMLMEYEGFCNVVLFYRKDSEKEGLKSAVEFEGGIEYLNLAHWKGGSAFDLW